MTQRKRNIWQPNPGWGTPCESCKKQLTPMDDYMFPCAKYVNDRVFPDLTRWTNLTETCPCYEVEYEVKWEAATREAALLVEASLGQ